MAQWVKNLPAVQETQETWVGNISGRRKMATPVFLPEKSHGQRSLVGYSPWGHKESDTTKRLSPTLVNKSPWGKARTDASRLDWQVQSSEVGLRSWRKPRTVSRRVGRLKWRLGMERGSRWEKLGR